MCFIFFICYIFIVVLFVGPQAEGEDGGDVSLNDSSDVDERAQELAADDDLKEVDADQEEEWKAVTWIDISG